VIKLDKQTRKWFAREVNAGASLCEYSRENVGEGTEYVYAKDQETGLPVFCGFQKIRRYTPSLRGKFEEIKTIETVGEKKVGKPKAVKPKENNHGTGGKFTYTKIYTKEFLKIPREQLSFELIGICLHLTTHIEWETGWLVCGRGKNRRFMNQRDIAKSLKISLGATNAIITKLRELKIVVYDDVKYKLDARFFAKGGFNIENKV
jgi:hypothetical protein